MYKLCGLLSVQPENGRLYFYLTKKKDEKRKSELKGRGDIMKMQLARGEC
jgi:hypothetical protein